MSEINKNLSELKNAIREASYAEDQKQYEEAYHTVFRILDGFEENLKDQTFLEGNALTDSDREFYEILIRFDTVYYFRSGLNQKRISEYENLWDYARFLYSLPEFKSVTDPEKIKAEEYLKDPEYNPLKIIPSGPDLSGWDIPSKRVVS
ncbi:MAG: hypothetical protein J5825_07410 [Lachnospiraceae bacterium]|nr:hypothetical protein [Lachnospiraceae bacterium]